MMRKSIHTKEYTIFLKLLIEARSRTGLTQAQLAKKLLIEQPAISKIERGERRLDVLDASLGVGSAVTEDVASGADDVAST